MAWSVHEIFLKLNGMKCSWTILEQLWHEVFMNYSWTLMAWSVHELFMNPSGMKCSWTIHEQQNSWKVLQGFAVHEQFMNTFLLFVNGSFPVHGLSVNSSWTIVLQEFMNWGGMKCSWTIHEQEFVNLCKGYHKCYQSSTNRSG